MGTKYTKEFKTEAIRLGEREGVSVAIEKLGTGVKMLYAWQRSQRLERGEAPEGLRSGESAEQGFKRLERENHELRDAELVSALQEVRKVHSCYGVQSMLDELAAEQKVSYGKAYRVCRNNGLLTTHRQYCSPCMSGYLKNLNYLDQPSYDSLLKGIPLSYKSGMHQKTE